MKAKRLFGILAALTIASMSAVSVNAQITNGNHPNEWMGAVTMQEKVNCMHWYLKDMMFQMLLILLFS